MNYSVATTVDATGARIIEFDAADVDSLTFMSDVAIYWGFGDLSQAIFPIPAQTIVAITNRDFRPSTVFNRNMPRTIKIFAKKQTAGTANIYIGYLGGNI